MLEVRPDIKEYLSEISSIHRLILIDEGLAEYYREPSIDKLLEYVENPDRDPYESFVILTSRGEVVGYGYVWTSEHDRAGYLRVYADPRLEDSLVLEAYKTGIAWSKSMLWSKSPGSGPVTVYVGARYKRRHSVLSRLLSRGFTEVPGYKIMVYMGHVKASKRPKGIEVETPKPPLSDEDINDITLTYNDAFSVYLDYHPWPLESAKRYYERRDWENYILVVARARGSIVGVAEGPVYVNMYGRKVAYLGFLAVRRQWQRRGVGSSLVEAFSVEAVRRGADLIVLDSEPKALPVYEKLGFTIVGEIVKLRGHVLALPG